MDIIHTDRLELKPMCMDYLYSTHEYVSDPETSIPTAFINLSLLKIIAMDKYQFYSLPILSTVV